MLGGRDQLFAIGVVVLVRQTGQMRTASSCARRLDAFQAPVSASRRKPCATSAGCSTLPGKARKASNPTPASSGTRSADAPGVLEDVLAALFAIARSDKAINARELDFLQRVHRHFNLAAPAWDRARGATPRFRAEVADDAYSVLGVARTATDEEVRAAWKALVRANHPDSLASRGVPAEFHRQRHGQGRRHQRRLGTRSSANAAYDAAAGQASAQPQP